MLSVLDHTLIPHAIKHDVQEDLFHDVPKYRGETHRPVVPQVAWKSGQPDLLAGKPAMDGGLELEDL